MSPKIGRKNWIKPADRWNTNDLARLFVPLDPKDLQDFAKLYHQKTGYGFHELMPPVHALQLITNADRPTRALDLAKSYLAFGIPTFPHYNEQVVLAENPVFVTRQVTGKRADRFLAQYRQGLTGWQVVQLANTLGRAKEAKRRQASRQNLGKHMGKLSSKKRS
jgi:hypothetical protein